MQAIITYNNTKKELDIEKERLEMLLDKKALLHSKYFKLTSAISEMGGHTDNSASSNAMTNYLIELNKVDKNTGRSLVQEIVEAQTNVIKLNAHLNKMTKNLIEMHGIEYELYSQIVVKGDNVTKAVEKVAEIYQDKVSIRTVWNIYNKKIKKFLKLQ